MTPKVHYRIDWQVPAEHAIGGVAYWDALILDPEREWVKSTTDEAEAREKFARAKIGFRQPVRLVRITEEVVEEQPLQPDRPSDMEE